MSSIDRGSYEQLQQVHHELSMIGETRFVSQEHFIEDWWAQEDTGSFHLGCPSFQDRRALALLVYAARALNAGEHGRAIELLKLALEEISVTQAALEQVQPN